MRKKNKLSLVATKTANKNTRKNNNYKYNGFVSFSKRKSDLLKNNVEVGQSAINVFDQFHNDVPISEIVRLLQQQYGDISGERPNVIRFRRFDNGIPTKNRVSGVLFTDTKIFYNHSSSVPGLPAGSYNPYSLFLYLRYSGDKERLNSAIYKKYGIENYQKMPSIAMRKEAYNHPRNISKTIVQKSIIHKYEPPIFKLDGTRLYRYSVNKKIINKDVKAIQLYNNQFRNVITDLNGVVENLRKGYAISAYLKDETKSRGDDNVAGTDLLFIDIDNATPKKIRYSDDMYLSCPDCLQLKTTIEDCLLLYTSPSWTEEWHRYRLIFELDGFVSDKATFNDIVSFYIKRYKADEAPKDFSRLWFGNNNGLYVFPQEDIINTYDNGVQYNEYK